jgi:GT2 family glycosyltransferase
MDVSVIVHLQGGPEQAYRCFESLAELPASPTFDVVVVDDASVGLGELFEQLAGDVQIISTRGRVGLQAAFLLGAERATADRLVILRDAPQVGHDALAPLVRALDDPTVSLAASRTAGAVAAHPVAAYAVAVRAADVTALRGATPAPPGLEFAAMCAELAALGRIESVADSTVHPPGTRMAAARGNLGVEPELTIVIPTLDAASARVGRCVAAAQQTTDAPHEIVLIDNGAPPQGFTAPVNAGLRAARGRYVVVMNDDVELLPGWWAPLRRELDRGASVVFPVTIDGAMRRDFAAWCFAMARSTMEQFSHAPGEFFDPRFRVWFQDTDLLVRLRAAGSPPECVEDSEIRHGLSETVASDDPMLRAWIKAEVERDQRHFEDKHPGVLQVGTSAAR